MKKFFLPLMVFVALSFFGCGGGGGSDPGDVFVPPPETTPPPGDGGGTVPVSAIQLAASSSAIKTGEKTTLTTILYDSTGQLVSGSKQITFSLDAPELGSIVSTAARSAEFTARNVEGTVTITATVDGVKTTKTIQISNLVAADTVSVVANPTSITLAGTSTISATVKDATGKLMPNGTTVNFTIDNTALGTIVAAATTTDGVAKATFSAGSTATGTATVTATSGSASGKTTIPVTGTAAGSIEIVSAIPQIVSIQGAGGQETSEIKFVVKDSNGNPIIGSQTVRLTLSGPNGGEYLGSSPGTSTIDVGTENSVATVILHSGSNPGTATVTATVAGTSLSTSSGVIAIGGGFPSAGHFSLSAEVLNIEGGAYDNVTDDILVLLADRYGNKNVLKGTTVSFYSECGAIDRAVALDEIGQGTVVFRTQTPAPRDVAPDALGTASGFGSCGSRCDQENKFISDFNTTFGVNITANGRGNPRDGLCSITAVVDGEEEFTDKNADGAYNAGENFTDTYDDIHIEMDDDRDNLTAVSDGKPHDPIFEDLVVDRNEDGNFGGLNGGWDKNKRIGKKIDLLYTGVPGLTLSTTSINVPHGGSQTIYFALHDTNYNRPIAGTALAARVSGSGTLSGTKSYTFLDSNVVGSPILSVTISDSDPEKNEAKSVELEFSWTWKGATSVLSLSGITR